jgi:hypothetical protein
MNQMYQVNRERWAAFSIFEQMGNIGSEVGRAFSAKRKGDSASVDAAVTRALDLFNATTENLISPRSPRLKEVLRSKEQFLHDAYNEVSDSEISSLENYFIKFAIAARAKH